MRLRTLAVDLADFQHVKGEGAVPLHVTKVPESEVVAAPRFKEPKIEQPTKVPQEVPKKVKKEWKPLPAPGRGPNLNGIGQETYERFNEMTTDELKARLEFIRSQMNFLTTMARELQDRDDKEAAERIRSMKYDDKKGRSLQAELNVIYLYLERFR